MHAPFTLKCTPNFAECLFDLNISLAVSTYQAGKLIFIGSKNKEQIFQLPRNFEKPMGFSFQDKEMVMATKDRIITFKNSPELAKRYPVKENHYDALFIPKTSYHTGLVDIHDIHFLNGEIVGVNTSFSCLVKFDSQYNFIPIWQPYFIDNLQAEDRCHLNGLVVSDNELTYVTALGKGNSRQSWREQIEKGGILMDVAKNEILLEGLAMPHSPKLYEGNLYFLESAKGTLNKFDVENKQTETIYEFGSFVRGLAFEKNFAFVAHSKIRKNSSSFGKIQVAEKSHTCAISVVHIPTKTLVARAEYLASVDEIYELGILKNYRTPNILNFESPHLNQFLDIPGRTFWAKAK